MQNFKQEYGVITWTNGTGADVSAGDIINLGPICGVAVADIADAASGSVLLAGVVNLAKDASAISQMDEVFWDVDGEQVTTSPATDDPRLGFAAAAAGSSASYVDVALNVPRCAGGVGDAIDSGAGDAAGNLAAIQSIITALENAGIVNRA